MRDCLKLHVLGGEPMSVDPAIVEDPDVMGGVPVFKGTRVPIAHVLASLRVGIEFEPLLEVYPFLTHELVDAALSYGAPRLARGAQSSGKRPLRKLVSSERVPLPPQRR